MAHTKQDLIASIKEMKAVHDDPDTPQSVKDSIKPSLDNAEKLLHELEAAEKPKATEAAKQHKPTAYEIVKATTAGKKKVRKARVTKTKVKHTPMTKEQSRRLTDIVKSAEKYAGYRGKSEAELKRDSQRTAKQPGTRTSKSGKTYREYRVNRTDVDKGVPHLKEGGEISSFEKEIKDMMKQENKWHFVDKEINGKRIYLKFFVGKKEVDVQRFTVDGIHARMPKNYVGKRETTKMILDNFERKFTEGGQIGKGKNGYIAFYKGKKAEVYADSSYQAQQTAAAHFKAKKSYDVTVVLAEKEGEQVTHVPDFAEGGAIADNQITYVGYTTHNLTKEGKDAFDKAIKELQSETDKESVYYKTADRAMEALVKNVDVVLGRPTNKHDAAFVHSMLQAIGISNYKTGMLLDTRWLDTELATRKLQEGGIMRRGGRVDESAVKKYLYEQLKNAGTDIEDFKHKVAQLKFDLHHGSVGEEDYQGWQTTKDQVDKMIDDAELPSTIYYDYESGSISESEPTGGYEDEETGEFIEDGGEWYEVDTKDVLLGELAQYFKKGGRIKSAINRDRKYQSGEPWEQNYQRTTRPRHPKYKTYAGGGTIENQYAGKTAEQVWNDWTVSQREHFLNDHGTSKFKGQAIRTWANKSYGEFGNTKFDILGKQIKQSLQDHIEDGQYARGGAIPDIAKGTKVTIDATKLNTQLNKAKSKKVQSYLKGIGAISNEIGEFQERVGYANAKVKFGNRIKEVPMSLLLPLSFEKGGKVTKMPKPKYKKDGDEWRCDIGGYVGHGMTKKEARKVATENWQENHFKKGGRVKFKDKVKAISKNLEGTKVPAKYKKDYGKRYGKEDSLIAARRIVGNMKKKEKN